MSRLHRNEGRVTSIREMQEGRRYCIDVPDQTSAARGGLEAIALLILEDHVNPCVREATGGEEKVAVVIGDHGEEDDSFSSTPHRLRWAG